MSNHVYEILSREMPAESRIRVLGRELAFAAYDHQRILNLGPVLAKLETGEDPDLVDREGRDFRAGALFALEVVSNGFLEMKPAGEE